MRALIAVLATVVGAGAVVFSTFQPWYGDRLGRRIPVSDLWNGVSAAGTTDMVGSLFVPMVAAAALALLGLSLRRRALLAVGTLVAVVVVVVFLGQQLQTEALASQFKQGFWNAAGGMLLLLVASVSGVGRRPADTPS